MSYEILYGKQFIKIADDKFIPMIYTGSNNCYEINHKGNEVRERHWHRCSFFSNGKLFPSAKDILEAIDKFRDSYIERYKNEEEKYSDDAFGYFAAVSMYGKTTHTTTFNQFKSFYKTGIKQAMTIEELKKFHISLSIEIYYYNSEDITKTGRELKSAVFFNSTEEIEKVYNEWVQYYGELSDRIYFKLNADENDLKKISKSRRKTQEKLPKQAKEVDSYWVLECLGGYFTKSTSRRIRYVYTLDFAKKFATEKQVNDFVKKSKHKNYFSPKEIKEKTMLYI